MNRKNSLPKTTNISLDEYFKTLSISIDQNYYVELSKRNPEMVFFPKIWQNTLCLSLDEINIIKRLRAAGREIRVYGDDKSKIEIIELRHAQIILDLGIILVKDVLPTLGPMLLDYIKSHIKGREKEAEVKLKYYDLRNGQLVEFEGPAETAEKLIRKLGKLN